MENETILYGVRVGNEDWQEEIITTHPDRFDAATEWAVENGFDPDRFRIATIDLSTPPDFTKTIA